jgi:hypothetical protein
MDEETLKYIVTCLDAQFRGEELSPATHTRLIQLVDAGLVGMDGFKYCWPEVAKENRKIFLEHQR